MKKKIVAILATIAAVFGFGFAANSAMADDANYGATAPTVSADSIAFHFYGLTKNGKVTVVYSDPVVDVQQIAEKIFTASAQGTLDVKYILKAGTPAGTEITAKVIDNTTGDVITSTAKVPATGTGTGAAGAADASTANGANGANGSTQQTASTGAAIAPYAVAVVLLAAAGISLIAVRKSSAR